ncbi:MAG: hypothetical protein WD965_00625, partial [Actinomycetota bacterium]
RSRDEFQRPGSTILGADQGVNQTWGSPDRGESGFEDRDFLLAPFPFSSLYLRDLLDRDWEVTACLNQLLHIRPVPLAFSRW